jgi:hypothetical protein
MALQTEHEFTLPNGYVEDGKIHKTGLMRLATAADEILPQKDPRVQNNHAYLDIIILSRVITRLGTLTEINPRIIEGLFIKDLAFLQDFYRRINGGDEESSIERRTGVEPVELSSRAGEL